MQNQNLKLVRSSLFIVRRLRTHNYELPTTWFLVFSFQLLVVFSLWGCGVARRSDQGKLSYQGQLSASYRQTKLQISSPSDVLATIHRPEYETFSQSKSVVASSGQNKEDYKTWFTMVTFGENTLTAKRKCFFVVDESPDSWLGGSRRGLMFDSEMILDRGVLDRPYASDSARQIAILRQVSRNVRRDIGQLAQDNKKLGICGMLINQVFETVFSKLGGSAVAVSTLSDTGGVEFDHMTLGNGSIGMAVSEHIVKVKIRLGSFYN